MVKIYNGKRGIMVWEMDEEIKKIKGRDSPKNKMGIVAVREYLRQNGISSEIKTQPLRIKVKTKTGYYTIIPKVSPAGTIMTTTISEKWKIGDIFVAVKLHKTRKSVILDGWLTKGELLQEKPKYVMGQLVRMPKKSTYRDMEELIEMMKKEITNKKKEEEEEIAS